ncbi:unnamed protein product [Pseudo-nitzschia multistriata]|uniref:2-methoxy-6-polyprenyl-1,4-benzoquinol methylase, mitochondrial n=1 Tax=Pseudo-nitzschia multistriata TaxID=183589 RepID=A0A448YVL0_9STRA|nr:unnamed protein product [Pseudo-nitzschia multistriata]
MPSLLKPSPSPPLLRRQPLVLLPLLVLLAGLLLPGPAIAAPKAQPGKEDEGMPGLDFGTGRMFDKIATRYDTINRVLALRMDIGWRRAMTTRLRELLGESDGESESGTGSWRILDVATGTADVALQLVDDLSGGKGSGKTTVLGLDPSANMLAVGRSKIERRGLADAIVLEQADARDLGHYYEPGSKPTELFDASTIAFGIRNVVPNREKALCEIHRLLKPDGVLAILEFSQPTYQKDGVMGVAAGLFIQHVVPLVGGLLSGGARKEYVHLQNSIRNFPGPEEFRDQLESLRCPLRPDDDDAYFYVGHFDMEETVHMNFGSVQLYVGRAAVRPKKEIHADTPPPRGADTKLPPIAAVSGGEL